MSPPRARSANHGRLPWLTVDDLDEAQRAVYAAIAGGPRSSGRQAFRLTDDAGRLEGPFNAMLTSPTVGLALQNLGAAIRFGSTLPDRAREIAILALSVLRQSEFEWYAHARIARQVGLTEDELDGLRYGKEPSTFSEAEVAALRVTTDLVTDRDIDDELFDRAERALGTGQLVELVTLVGYYDLLALSLRALRTPLPAGERATFAAVTRP
jgi:4-carboxymuconolactone decarboxylase